MSKMNDIRVSRREKECYNGLKCILLEDWNNFMMI